MASPFLPLPRNHLCPFPREVTTILTLTVTATISLLFFKSLPPGLGPGVKNLPFNAGNTGLIPGQETKIPHALGQVSPHATTNTHVPQLRHNAAKTKNDIKKYFLKDLPPVCVYLYSQKYIV